jgi:hypothetical protein
MIYTTSIDTRIFIDGVDYSEQLIDVIFTDDFITDTGLVTTKGTANINRGTLETDDWSYDVFRLGSVITIDVDLADGNGWRRHPRGYSILVGTAYNEGINTLELLCPISARIAQKTTYSQLRINPTGTFQSIVSQLFNLAGLSSVVWNVTDDYDIHSRLDMSGGYLETAGNMLADSCCYAWVNGSGVVNIDAIQTNPNSEFSLNFRELASYTRVLIGKPPTSLAKVSGTYRKHTNRENVRTLVLPIRGDIGSIVPSAAGTGIITQLTTIDTLSQVDKTVSNIKLEDRLGYQVYAGISGYARTSTVRASSVIGTKQYSLDSDDKLKSFYEVSSAPRYLVLKSFCDWTIEKKISVGLSGDTTEYKIRKFYEFDDRDQPISELTIKTVAIGTLFASIPGIDWQVVYDAFGVPDDEIVSERTYVYWKAVSPGEWKKVTIITMSNILIGANGQGIEEKIRTAPRSALIGIYRNAVACGSVKIIEDQSTTGQVSPGSVERFPYVIGLEKLNLSIDLRFNGFRSGWENQPKGYSVEYCPDVFSGQSQLIADFIRRFGMVWHLLSIQRWQAVRLTLPFRAELFDYKPYKHFTIVDEGVSQIVALNGTNWLIEPEKAVVSSGCALIAIGANGVVKPKYSAQIPLILNDGDIFTIVSTPPELTLCVINLNFGEQLPVISTEGEQPDYSVIDLNFGEDPKVHVSNLNFESSPLLYGELITRFIANPSTVDYPLITTDAVDSYILMDFKTSLTTINTSSSVVIGLFYNPPPITVTFSTFGLLGSSFEYSVDKTTWTNIVTVSTEDILFLPNAITFRYLRFIKASQIGVNYLLPNIVI